MQEGLIQALRDHQQWAILISLCASILVAIVGVIPSVFITGANILFFGFWTGTLISFLGEAAGAAVAYLLYRKGFKRSASGSLHKYPKIARLVGAEGARAFGLILSLRLLPFMPSGLVTFAAAIGKVSLPLFFVASSLGKIPALLIEAGAVYGAGKASIGLQLLLAGLAILLLYFTFRKAKADGKK